MEALVLHTGEPTIHLEDNTSCIYAVGAKIVTPSVKHIYITVYFLLEQFYNGLFSPNANSLVSCRKICAPNHVQVQL